MSFWDRATFASSPTRQRPCIVPRMAEADRLVTWLRDQLARTPAHGFVFGLSGGIDSAVVARLCQQAAPGRVLGLLMPCHSDPGDEADARLVARHFGLETLRIDLAPPFDALVASLGAGPALPAADGTPPDDLRSRMPLANIKPRLRMTALYAVANTMNSLVAGTGNRSELAIGYFTKYGDGGADLLPLGRLLKSEVRALARALDVPARILDKPPSAGLWPGQTDEQEMGFTYEDLEAYLIRGAAAVDPRIADRIARLARASDHKRSLPAMPEPQSAD
jgi:NAD+ synthase